jgi:hypothetical protein
MTATSPSPSELAEEPITPVFVMRIKLGESLLRRGISGFSTLEISQIDKVSKFFASTICVSRKPKWTLDSR